MDKGLLIEDDQDIANVLIDDLAEANLFVDHIADGKEGLAAALSGKYAFVLLDWMLPSLDGSEVCRRIRQEDRSIPIILLTAKNRSIDKVLLLELGADDYITKPFDLDEVRARIKAVLRRVEQSAVGGASASGVVVYQELEIDLQKRSAQLAGKTIELTAREFDILALLAEHAGKPLSKKQICEAVDGSAHAGYERALSSTINRMRSRLEPDPKNPQFIKTAHRFGYFFPEIKNG